MKIETFFEKFDLFADAPDAVAKIRELVLNFAVSGRLSEHRDGDAPVSELVDALSAAKARRGKNGRRGAGAAVPPESIIDRPVDAPAHWAWVPLNEIGAMSGGMTPSKDKSAFWDGDVNWFSSKDIKTDELTESELKITRDATEATGLQVYSPGSLVMVARSGILKRTFPVSILRVEGTVNQDLKVLTSFVGGMERYLQIMLRGMTGFILKSLVKTGMTVQSLKYEEFEAQPFPLPPLAEQKRIVAKVDELMALCDRLEAQQQERKTRHAALSRASLARFADAPTPANLEFLFHKSYTITPADLRKSILTLAVKGKLVPQDPTDEPVDMLLARLMKRDVQNNGRRKRSQPDLAFTPDEIPFELPAGWTWERLGNIGETNIGLTYSPQDVSDVGIPVLRSSNIQNGKLDYDDLVRVTCEPKQSVMVQDGDLLICARNGSRALVGKVAVIEDLKEPAAFGAFMAIYRSEVNPYLYHFIRSPLFRQMIDEVNTTTINQITQNNLRSTLAPIPPLAEQRRIVAKVDQLMDLVDALESQLVASQTTSEKLIEAVVTELASAT